jgi:hypothetical protein
MIENDENKEAIKIFLNHSMASVLIVFIIFLILNSFGELEFDEFVFLYSLLFL